MPANGPAFLRLPLFGSAALRELVFGFPASFPFRVFGVFRGKNAGFCVCFFRVHRVSSVLRTPPHRSLFWSFLHYLSVNPPPPPFAKGGLRHGLGLMRTLSANRADFLCLSLCGSAPLRELFFSKKFRKPLHLGDTSLYLQVLGYSWEEVHGPRCGSEKKPNSQNCSRQAGVVCLAIASLAKELR